MKLLRLFTLCLAIAAPAFAQTLQDDQHTGGTDNRLLSGAVLTLKAGSTVVLESGATFTVPDGFWSIAKVNGLQSALDGRQPVDGTLTALAGVTTTANTLIYATGADTFATTALSLFARTLIDDADASTMRGTLGLVIGTNVQAYDADLGAIAAFSGTGFAVRTAGNTWAQRTLAVSGLATLANANGVSGNPSIGVPAASSATTITGTSTTEAVTPAGDRAALRAYVDPVKNIRGLRQGVAFNGGTYSSTNIAPVGSAPFTYSWIAAYEGGGASPVVFNGSLRPYYSGDGSSLYVYDAAAAIGRMIATGLSTSRAYRFTYTRTAAGAWTAYVDDTLTFSGTETSNYSEGITVIGAENIGLANAFVGRIYDLSVYTYALTADQVARLFAAGSMDPMDRLGGRQKLADPGFETSVSGWITDNGVTSVTASSEGITAHSGTKVLKAVGPYIYNTPPGDFLGQISKLSCWVYSKVPRMVAFDTNTGTADNLGWSFDGVATSAPVNVTPGVWHKLEARMRAKNPGGVGWIPIIYLTDGDSSSVLYVDDATITTEGALVASDPQWQGVGNYWTDESGNGGRIELGVGVQPLLQGSDGWIYAERDESGFLVGDRRIVPVGYMITEVWVKTTTLTSLGLLDDVSGTSIYSPYITTTPGKWVRVTPAEQSATGKLYYSGAAVDRIVFKIRLTRI